MRLALRRGSLCKLFVLAGLCAGQTAAPLLTLDEALGIARKQNAQIQVSHLDLDKANEQTRQLRTEQLPVIKVMANVGESLVPIDLIVPKGALGIYPATGPIPTADTSIKTPRQITGILYGSAAQPLSQLYKIGLGLREGRLLEDLARERERQQVQDITRQVKQAYYQIVQLQSQIVSSEAMLAYLHELRAFTDRNLAQETVLKSDSLNVKTKLSQQQFQLLRLRDSLATQKEALNRLLGRDLRTNYATEAPAVATAEEENLEAAQAKALAQRPELRQARLQTQRNELEVRRERAEYIPDISAQISYLSFPNVAFFPKNVLMAGVSLQWQPLDWGLKRHKLGELKAGVKQAALSEHDAQQQILLDVNSNFRKLAEARALLAVDQASQELEREKLRVITNRYKEKSALLTDVLQQQSALAQADAQYQQDLANVWLAKGNLERALGEQ